jgi:hypothetical protein
MTDEHLSSYRNYIEKLRKESKKKLDEIYKEQVRRANERSSKKD